MSGRFAYVACGDTCEIEVWRLDGTSARQVARTKMPGSSGPSASLPLALSPDRRILHAALRDPPYPVSSFAIDPTDGTLHAIGTATLPASMAAIATDRAGRWLAGASYGGAVVAVVEIGADGAVSDAPPQTATTPPKAHHVVFAPDNRFLYATTLGGDAILRWDFSADTGLHAPDHPHATALRPGAGPRHMAFGRGALYVINELDGTLDAFGHDAATGALTHRQTIAAFVGDGGAQAADIHLTPNCRFLYASVRRDSTLSVYSVDASDGALALVDRIAVETTPRSFAVDPDGAFILCAGRDAAAFGVYAIEAASGRLTAVARHATGGNPNWIEIVDV